MVYTAHAGERYPGSAALLPLPGEEATMAEYLQDIRDEATGVLDVVALGEFRDRAGAEQAEFADGDTRCARDEFAAIIGQLIQGIVAEIGAGMPAAMVCPEEAAQALFGSQSPRDIGPMGWGYVVAELAELILRDPFEDIEVTPFDL